MKKFKEYELTIIKYLLLTGLIILAIVKFDSLKNIGSFLLAVSMPIIMGFVLAYILNIPMSALEKRYFPNSQNKFVIKSRRPISILISIIIIAVVLIIVLSLVIPQIITVLGRFIEVIPELAQRVQSWVIENEEVFPPLADFVETSTIDWQNIVSNALSIVNRFTSNVIGTTLSTVGSVFSIVVNWVLSLMISIYVLMAKDTLKNQFVILSETYLSSRMHKNLLYVLKITNHSFHHFITGAVLEAMILGSLVTVGMWIFRFPYASMIGALTGVTSLIPVLGAYLSGAVGFLLIIVDSPVQAFAFLIFITVLQQLEGNLIYPRIVGGTIGLPGLWVLVAITIGGGLLGVWGMLLAVPFASTLYKLVKNDVAYRRNHEEVESSYSDIIKENTYKEE